MEGNAANADDRQRVRQATGRAMSKLSVTSSFDAVPSLVGMHAPRTAARGRLASADDLGAALTQTFDLARDRVVCGVADFAYRQADSLGRLLRFDPEHAEPSPVATDPAAASPAAGVTPQGAVQRLATAVGLAQARDVWKQDHWIVAVIDARTVDASLVARQLHLLARLPRVLVLWCHFADAAATSPAGADAQLERWAADAGLTHVGPPNGLDLDGICSLLHSLKTLDQSALVQLRLCDIPAPPPVHRGTPSPGGSNGHGNGRSNGNGHSTSVGPRRGRSARVSDSAGLAPWAARLLIRLAERDPALVIVDLSRNNSLSSAGRRLLGRCLAAPPTETNAWAWCAGLAAGGCRPLVVIDERRMREFLPRDACAEQVPVRLLIIDAREETVEPNADARHFDIAWLRQRGDWAILAPADRDEVQGALQCALEHPGPIAVYLPAQLPVRGPHESPCLRLGSAVLESPSLETRSSPDSLDVAIVAWGPMVAVARAAMERLWSEDISAAVLNLRSLAPLDAEALADVAREASALLVLEGSAPGGGCFAPLCEILAHRGISRAPSVLFAEGRDSLTRVVERCRQLVRADADPLKSLGPLPPDQSADSTPDRPTTESDERAAIVAKRFSPWLAGWIDEYSRVGQRGIYLWRWCLHGVELTTLPCVPPELRADAADTKVLAGMLNVLFDDVADQQGNGELLNELLKITHQGQPDFGRFSPADRAYAEFTCRVWDEFWRRARRYPCYEVYRELLHYDLAQLFNTVRYSHLVNCNPYILNLVEHDDYSAQGMGLLSFATVDLMCTPGFPVHELGTLRQAIWHGQWMARIGNLISTWQREVKDRDYTSGVFARAVAASHVTIEQLMTGDPAEIERAIERGGHEAHFLRRWRHHHAHLRAMQPHVSSVDLCAVAKGLERLLQTELVSRGSK